MEFHRSKLTSRHSLTRKPNPFTAVITCIVLAAITAKFFSTKNFKRFNQIYSNGCNYKHRSWLDTNNSIASQGKLWKPIRNREFPINLLQNYEQQNRLGRQQYNVTGFTCQRWAVITTIFQPSKLLYQLKELRNWCLVIVGDQKTEDSIWLKFVSKAPITSVYLSESDQRQLPYKIIQRTPWNHFGRKNVGYLYAIHHGAQTIWDTDDDNELIDPNLLTELDARSNATDIYVAEVNSNHHLLNPYPIFRPYTSTLSSNVTKAWPRGFPLSSLKNISTEKFSRTSKLLIRDISIFQSLANNDPDVDAIYRLTQPLPLSFSASGDTELLAVPHGTLAPFNAQATLWKASSFWALYLPISVHGRVSDIWRSYFAQCLMRNTGKQVAFSKPIVTQFRNIHSYIADLQAEIPLYTQADELTRWLLSWEPPGKILKLNIQKLYQDLYEIGVIDIEDIQSIHAWIKDLGSIAYTFP